MQKYNRRCNDHDYQAPGFYMITLTAAKGTPRLSEIRCSFGNPFHDLTAFGKRIRMHIAWLNEMHPFIRRYEYVIMPDHIHFRLHVMERIPMHLGQYLGAFMRRCTQEFNNFRGDGHSISLFPDGYHDRIVWRSGQNMALRNYILDNPRRYWIKHQNPGLFSRYLNLEINGKPYAAFGNIMLLKDFDKVCVRAHRVWTDADYMEERKPWVKCADNGGVLISPFIHPYEHDMKKIGFALGARFIQIQKEGIPERFSPQGKKFELCAEGRLLIIAPWPDNKRKEDLYRNDCMAMNDIAELLTASDLQLKLNGFSI